MVSPRTTPRTMKLSTRREEEGTGLAADEVVQSEIVANLKSRKAGWTCERVLTAYVSWLERSFMCS